MQTLLAQGNVGTETVLFWILALISGGSALMVVASRNIVRMAVALLFTLVGVAGLYFLLLAEFLAAVQLVVYAGGTLILIVFGVMLTNKLPSAKLRASPGEFVAATMIGMVLLAALVWGIAKMTVVQASTPEAGLYPMDKLGLALLGDFLVPFEMVSVVLLVVMIGAAYLAKARRKDKRDEATERRSDEVAEGRP
jgi:NADH-quinone oxidoreductase subunit J